MSSRTWFRVHSFTGVITGLLLFVICWSGTFAVLSNEIDWLVNPAWRVPAQDQEVDWPRLETAARAVRPASRLLILQAPLYDNHAALALFRHPDGHTEGVVLDPAGGGASGLGSVYTAQRFFRNLHRRLFFPNPWGVLLTAAFAVTMLVSLVAVLRFYKRWWRRFFRVPAAKGRRQLWSEAHKLTGLWSLWFLMVIALTGVWYGFEQLRIHWGDGVGAYAGPPERAARPVPLPASDAGQARLPLDALMEKVRQVRPELEVSLLGFMPNGVLYVHGQAGHLLVGDSANQLWLDGRTGQVLHQHRASDLPPYWRWANTANTLHFGDFGGLASKLVWFIFGLLLSGLILTGTWLHARRLVRDAGGRARHRWPGTSAAIIVSLLVLAAAAPAGFQEARQFFGPTVDGVKRLPALAPGVRAVIIGWTAVTLSILAGWACLLWRARTAEGRRPRQRSR